MSGSCAKLAEIVGGADQAFAEVMLPDSVDHHAGCLRIVFTGEPVSELEPAGAGDGADVGAAKDFWESARHGFAEAIVAAAEMNFHILRRDIGSLRAAAFLEAVGDGDWRGSDFAQREHLGPGLSNFL